MENCWPAGLGLCAESSNQEIKEKVFQFVHEVGTLTFATIAVDGITPTVRALEVHHLDDEGNLYIGMSHGKPIYQEVKKNPRICGGLVQLTSGKLGIGIRINAELEETKEEAIVARYWKQNPGTVQLYSRDWTNFSIFRLTKGDGELFDLCEDSKTLRFRFGFGDASPRPWRYTINERCIGCGVCADICMMSVIHVDDNRAVINHNGCLECGLCYEKCPVGAVSITE